MSEISRDEVIKYFEDAKCEDYSHDENGIYKKHDKMLEFAISDMQKLEKIEEELNKLNVTDICSENLTLFTFKIRQIVRGKEVDMTKLSKEDNENCYIPIIEFDDDFMS